MAFREVAIPPVKARARAATKFVAPESLDAAEIRRVELVTQINDINSQLTSRNGARDDLGNFMEDAQSFFTWRKRAVAAKRHLEGELMHLKLWIKQQRRAAPIHDTAGIVDAADPVSMLSALYDLVHRLACEGVDLDPDEQALKDAVREYLNQPKGVRSC